MSRFLLSTFICLLVSILGVAQQTKSNFFITGKIKVEQGIVDKTLIQVFRDEALLNTIFVNSTGNFRIGLDINHAYRFVIGKEGFYTKKIEVDTHVPKEVCSENCNFPPYQLSVLLYKTVPGVIEASSQIGKISYNSKVDNFDAELLRENSDLSSETKKAIEEIKAQSKLYEKQSADLKKENYRKALAEADQLVVKKDYNSAMLKYRDAVMIFPEVVYSRNKVNQLYQLLVSEEMTKSFGAPSNDNLPQIVNYGDKKFAEREFSMSKIAYEQALQIKPDDESIKNKLFKANSELMNLNDLAISEVNHRKTVYNSRIPKYNELITNGDQKFLIGEFAEAKDFYAQAAMQIDENSYSLLMIKKIDALLGSDEAALKLAREREDAEKLRLREARNKAYTDAVSEADRLFNERLYRDAQEYYELALTIKTFEFYPQQQLRLIKNILANLQLTGEDYNRLLREGEKSFIEKKYSDAKSSYQKAHDLIPNEKFALLKTKEIDDLLNNQNEEVKINEQYNFHIQRALQFTQQKKYSEAIAAYQDALSLKPSEEFPKIKIKEIREILSRENDAMKRSSQLQTDFNKFIKMADDAFLIQSYLSARTLYQEALNIIPAQAYPEAQIIKIEAILKEKEAGLKGKSKLDQIDFTKLDNISADLRKAAYEEAMQLGNSFIQTEEWGLARFYFRRALALYPSDLHATQKLTQVDSKIRGGNVDEAKFNELIVNADEAFKTSDFSVAKFYYNKAREIKPENVYVNERLQIVSKLAETTSARNANEEYNTAINKGNEALAINNYAVARFFFRKALSLKPNDDQAKTKLAQVESLIIK